MADFVQAKEQIHKYLDLLHLSWYVEQSIFWPTLQALDKASYLLFEFSLKGGKIRWLLWVTTQLQPLNWSLTWQRIQYVGYKRVHAKLIELIVAFLDKVYDGLHVAQRNELFRRQMMFVVRIVDTTATPELLPDVVNRAELETNHKVQCSLQGKKKRKYNDFLFCFWHWHSAIDIHLAVVLVQVLELSQVFNETVFWQENVFNVDLAEVWQIIGQLEEVVVQLGNLLQQWLLCCVRICLRRHNAARWQCRYCAHATSITASGAIVSLRHIWIRTARCGRWRPGRRWWRGCCGCDHCRPGRLYSVSAAIATVVMMMGFGLVCGRLLVNINHFEWFRAHWIVTIFGYLVQWWRIFDTYATIVIFRVASANFY